LNTKILSESSGFFCLNHDPLLSIHLVPEFIEGSGAISRYPLQSCAGNTPAQGFPLLSGLRHPSPKEVLIQLNRSPNRPFDSKLSSIASAASFNSRLHPPKNFGEAGELFGDNKHAFGEGSELFGDNEHAFGGGG